MAPNDVTTQRLATALGAFSLGLGLAELAAPRSVARLAGLAAGLAGYFIGQLVL